ncbi:putative lipoprotein [Sphingomonas sp. S17]|uniref:Lipoprotein n=2 Tax=Sphingomonas paucimobilis TaxID=13689 RepID=A0A411LMT4_SPHPI|nr:MULTISPECIES: hypothetical protein [Sphingomonas]EGI55218.1 putative lipoprotein [Sphingomonas sp. S17]MBQ1478465.1 hypothetical protein [Sphingomonas sp.]MCM3679689.1 hypothetical protein [Sphingomonas paucimobilis]MDG5970917.1 hypothetical protein [Sphingomonas paucimobilis]NNG58405.1 hypothetical protein [Sphingomonas paucimobilis]
MASIKRFGLILMTSSACAALAACGGADSVASPGAGNVVIVQPAPTPTPSPTPAPTANITAAQFAAATTVNGVTITVDEQLAIVNAGSNNNVNGTGGTLNGIYPTSSTSLTTASDPSTLNSFFTSTNYVGALNGPSDTAFQGWTCNSTSAEFGGSGARCTAVPSIGTYSASTSVCPTGTIDDGTNSSSSPSFRFCRIDNTITTTQNVTLPKIAGVVYRLRGQTEVGTDLGSTGGTGVTLTIAPGVVIAADSSEATNDLLLVNRGSKISAVGTRDAPIVFTSQQNLVSNGVSDATQGQWGGIILLGRAPTAVCATGTGPNNAAGTSTTCQLAIEGVTGRFYGGANQADSSGQMSYVQIRYSGIAISDGNELQGLTLGGTGSGTVLDHIQSHNSADDGIEIFGGTSNLKYIAITGADDDGFDIDNGYRGFMQFLIAAQRTLGATADSFSTEIDSNNAEDLLPRTFGRYANFTFVQTANAPAAIRLRGGADMTFINGIVKSTQSGVACVNLIAGAGSGADRTTIRAANADLQDQGPPVFTSVYFSCNGR